MAAPTAGRTTLSLQSPTALRDQAARVGRKIGRKGSPRRRYLKEQRAKFAGRLLPALAIIGASAGLFTIVDLWTGGSSMTTTILGASIAVCLGAGSLAVPVIHRRSSGDGLAWLAVAASAVTMIGVGFMARETGGASSPYLLWIALAALAFGAVVPLPTRAALANAVAAYAGLLVASLAAPAYAHVTVLACGLVGIGLARTRQRVNVATFLRVERLTAAVSRMRRVQEQLVVVEKLEALRVLVGGMAHELNNALAISVASTQQAARVIAPEEAAAQAALKRSEGGLARIRRTVDRLRRFAMAAEGVLEPADVGAMLDFALESAIGRARSGVIVTRHYDPGVGAIECHVAALAEALFQIARNAVEAMPGGGTISATVRSEGERVILAVSDEGDGIPADQLAHVFDPFYSRGRGQTSKSGLGLSAVYGLVSALGGKVEIQSAVGKGTEVAIVMPRRRAKSTLAP